MRRTLGAVLVVVVLSLAVCSVARASEKISLGKNPIRAGVVFTSDNFDIPDDLADLVTNLFGNALAKTNTIKIVRFDRINSARQELGFVKASFSSPHHLSAIGKKADVHFIIVTKIIYDLEKAATKGAAKGIGKLFDVDVSPLVKQEKPEFEVSIFDCASMKIIYDNNLKMDLFSSQMKKDLLAGLVVGGGSLNTGSIDLAPIRKLAEQLAPIMETAITEAALLKIQKETKDYEGMMNTVIDVVIDGNTHDKDDIKAAVLKALGNDIENNEQVDGVIDKVMEITGKENEQDKEKIKAALVQAIQDGELPAISSDGHSSGGENSTQYTLPAGTSAVPERTEGKILVGVMPFLSSNGDVDHTKAELIGDIFTQMLAMSGKITIVGRELLTSIAAENRLAISGYISNETALRVGNLASCDVIITGSVTDYKRKVKTSGVLVVSSAKEEARAAADVQVINVKTGGIILSLSESGRAAQRGSAVNILGIFGGKAQVSGMEAGAVAELASILAIKIRGVLTGEYPEVTSVSRKEITFNIGTLLGSKKNGFYRVYTVEDGEEKNVAVVRVKSADNNSSTAVIGGKKMGRLSYIRVGDRVEPLTTKSLKSIGKIKSR